MHIPAEHVLRSLLKRGLVLKIKGEIPFVSEHFHHFVVLNYSPTTETVVILAHATHQVEAECVKAEKQGEDVNSTIVVIPPGRYSFFPKQTAFNCNEPHELSFDQLVQALQENVVEVPPNDILSVEDVELLCKGVLASSQTPPYIAKLLVP